MLGLYERGPGRARTDFGNLDLIRASCVRCVCIAREAGPRSASAFFPPPGAVEVSICSIDQLSNSQLLEQGLDLAARLGRVGLTNEHVDALDVKKTELRRSSSRDSL